MKTEKETKMSETTNVSGVYVENASAPCIVAVSPAKALKIQKEFAKAALDLGVGKKVKKVKNPASPEPRAKRTAEPRAKRAPQAHTKQSMVNALVKGVFEGRNVNEKPSKDLKLKIVHEIMTLCNMSQTGATTYFYNALKTL